MKTAVELIKHFEGCKLKAYKCPAGVWTIGYGATGLGIVEGVEWTQEQADTRLAQDVDRFKVGVLKWSPSLINHPNRWEAVTSFAYNIGLGNYQKSTMRQLIDAGHWAQAAQEFSKWTKAGGKELIGLVRRRKAERSLFEYSE